MKSLTRRATGLGAAAALVMSALALGTPAQSAPGPAADRPKLSGPIGLAEQAQAKQYWTAQRMKNAVPGARLLKGRNLSKDIAPVARGTATVIEGTQAPQSATGQGVSNAYGGGLYTGSGKVVRTTGKVFFNLRGADYQCSGSSVIAANESLVQTAGHCLNEGPGRFASSFIFVPQYRNGSAPYGQFAATRLATTSQWGNGGDINYDVGYATVGTAGGRTLADTVGTQGVGFSLRRNATMYAFGYPASYPYDGSKLAWCSGSTFRDSFGGTGSQGMRCNMTGGSSGGPWFIDYNASTGVGTLNSVNSFGYNTSSQRDIMYGPYFGSTVQSLYNAVRN